MRSASTKRRRVAKPSPVIGKRAMFSRTQIRTLERMAAAPSTGDVAWLEHQLQARP